MFCPALLCQVRSYQMFSSLVISTLLINCPNGTFKHPSFDLLDCCITDSQDGFQIEQTNEGTLRIVWIHEQNTNANDDYSVERARTPKTTTVRKKRTRDELSKEIKRTRGTK